MNEENNFLDQFTTFEHVVDFSTSGLLKFTFSVVVIILSYFFIKKYL